MTLYLRRAVPDSLEARIAPQALDRKFLHQPHAAVDLHRMVGDPIDHFRAIELYHRDIGIGQGSRVGAADGVLDQEIAGPEFGRHVGELEARALKLADGLTELLAGRRPFRGQTQEPLGLSAA